MKKLVVVLAILAAAAACGELSSPGHTASAPAQNGFAQNASSGKSIAQPAIVAPNTGATTTAPTADTTLPVQGPQVIRQAQLSLTVSASSFDSKLTQVRNLVEQEQGFISGTDASANPLVPNDQMRSGVITFMVPADKFDETIDLVSKLGTVQSEHISGNDVSAQYVDLQARLANAEAQRDAMIALLGKAQTISDIIAVQTQLGQITQQIEELKGQISYIDHNTTYSTVTVQLTEAGAPAPTTTSTDTWGFSSAMSAAAHNFVTTINYIVSGLGALGPVLILVGLGYLVWRRRRSLPVPRPA